MVQPSVNTAVTSSSDRSASSSRPTLHSTVARRVRCRSGRSTAPVPSASSEAASRSSSAGGSSSRVRAAASSIASGRPSSRRQISATAAALPSVRAKPGRTARARSTNSATAGEAATSATEAVAGSAGNASGGTGYSRSARSPSTVRLVAKIATPGQRASSSPRSGATWTTCSRLSRTSSHAPSPNVSASASSGEPGPRQVGARGPADGGQDLPRVGDRIQRHEHGARAEPVSQPLAHRHRQPGLADPARPGQRHQPHLRTLDQPGHLVDGPLPPQQRRRAHRQRARAAARAGDGAAAAAWPRSGGEPLAQQHRQVITHQPAQLGGGAEMPVGRRGLLLDAGQQIGQPRARGRAPAP